MLARQRQQRATNPCIDTCQAATWVLSNGLA